MTCNEEILKQVVNFAIPCKNYTSRPPGEQNTHGPNLTYSLGSHIKFCDTIMTRACGILVFCIVYGNVVAINDINRIKLFFSSIVKFIKCIFK